MLVTAKHVVPNSGIAVVALPPGTQSVFQRTRPLFEDKCPNDVFRCKFKDAMANVDICILDCSESTFRAENWVDLSSVYLKAKTRIDVIGYPGIYSTEYLMETQDMEKIPSEEEYRIIEKILPKGKLIVSHGPVIRGGKMPMYKISTIGGMSGSAMVKDGKVVGKAFCVNKVTHIRSTHWV